MRIGLIGLICLIVLGFSAGLDVRILTSNQDEEIELDLQLEEQDIGLVFLDLPNGEATYIELPNNDTILIGTGADDSAEELFYRLKKLNVEQINTIILPRFEKEYSGNVEKIITEMDTKQLIVPEPGLSQAINEYQKFSIDIIGWEANSNYSLSDYATIKTLSNQSSLLPMVSFILSVHEKHHFFFSSEASEQLERIWVEDGLSRVSILKVAEFGAEVGTTQRFLNEIDPEVAILFTKQDAEISSQLLERLQETWIDTYTMKQNGSVIVKVNAYDYELVTVHF
jgi:beta-lactamase superfamily II metal-dependent hydrolase